VDWPVAAAALAATTNGSAAAIVVAGRADDLLRAHVAECVTSLADIADLCTNHDRVLVIAATGLLTPLGDSSSTAADLATELRAPVVVVTDTGPDAVLHTTLTLDALDRRLIPATVIAVGDGGDFSALPVRLAGQIPSDAGQRGDGFAEAAKAWVEPLDGRLATQNPVLTAPRPRRPSVAKRVALILAVAFVVELFVLWLFIS
jgi:hypothetical protein